MKITKQDRNRIRNPYGGFVSDSIIEDIKILKQFNPRLSYKDLTKGYFKENPELIRFKPLKDSTGQFLAKNEINEIKKAAKDLGIPLEQAKAIHSEGRLIRQDEGYTPLHTVSDIAGGYAERNKNYKVKIKLPGEKRFRVFKDIDRAMNLIDKIKSEIYETIRAESGKSVIPSSDIPVIPLVEKFKPGEFLPTESIFDFTKVTQLGELDEDDYDNVMEKIQDFTPKKKTKTKKRK